MIYLFMELEILKGIFFNYIFLVFKFYLRCLDSE